MIDTKNLRNRAELAMPAPWEAQDTEGKSVKCAFVLNAPWEAQDTEVPYQCKLDFRKAMTPEVAIQLLDALERKDAALLCAERILAWVCFGDRRALDDGPVLTATDAYNAITKELTP